jgi:hypothetical protein
MMTWRADDIYTCRRWWIACHDRDKRAGCHIFIGQAIGKPSDAESCGGGGNERCAVVGFKAPPWMNRDDLVAIHELPGFRSLHEGLMGNELLRRLRGTVRFEIVRARDELPVKRPDASCDQVGVLEIANSNRTIKTLCDEINEAIAVVGMDVELRVASRHFRENGSEVGWAKRKRRCNSQPTAKVTSRQDRFPGHIDFSAGSGCMVSKREPSFCESGTARGSCKKLDAKFRFESGEPSTDD